VRGNDYLDTSQRLLLYLAGAAKIPRNVFCTRSTPSQSRQAELFHQDAGLHNIPIPRRQRRSLACREGLEKGGLLVSNVIISSFA
jgi:hypothetical protein